MHAVFLSDDDSHVWRNAEALVAGVGSGDASIVSQVGIAMESGYRVRVDIQASTGYSCFQEVRCVGNAAYIGHGKCLIVACLHERSVKVHVLDGYFGHLYEAEELEDVSQVFAVLAASASELLCFSMEGVLQWRTSGLGLDGVLVESVQSGVIKGCGEWDPPGGWKSFTVSARTGEIGGSA